MPSLRTIFLLATAAFASLAYAAPVGEVSSGQLSPVTGATSNGPTLPQPLNNGNPNAGGLGLPVPKPATSNQVVQKRDSTPDSLPVILQALEAKLKGILDELNSAVVDTALCLPILHELRDLLAAALKSVQALVGLPLNIVCALAGAVLSALDIARLLAGVLTLLCQILLLICKVVGASGLNVVEPLVAEIGSILCQILTCVFGLVAGLLVALVPLLGEVIKDLLTLNLKAVLDILKVAHA